MKLQRRTVAVIAIAVASLCLVGTGLLVWRVERAIGGVWHNVAQEGALAVEVRTLGTQPNPGFEGMTAPAAFNNAAQFQGSLYLSGPAGLYVYASDGQLDHIYRTGIDLPAAPLRQMAVGLLTGSQKPELLIATSGAGVLAFDGRLFRQILASREEARDVTALLPLASGRLLIGTAKAGLLVFDGKVLRSFHPTTDKIYVTALAGTDAELWVGTLNDGLLYWHGGQTDRIGEEQGLPDRRVEQIALGQGDEFAGRAYVGTPVGVAEVRDGKIMRVLAKGRYAHALLADGDSLFLGQFEAGVMRVSLTRSQDDVSARRAIVAPVSIRSRTLEPRTAVTAAPMTDTVEQFLAIGDSRYALANDGLLKLESDGAWRRILGNDSSQLTDSHISALLVASDGRLWVGYFDRGLDILSATGGQAIHIENEHVFCVNRIVEDTRHGAVAVATANGLVMFDRDGRQKQVLERDAGLIADTVTDVALFGDGMALATPAGITFLDASGAHSLYAFQGLVNNHVYALAARGDRLVAGTLGGLSLLEHGEVRRNLTTATSGLKHNWITALVQAGNDSLVGTYGAGVLRLSADGTVTPTDATRNGVVINPTAMVADGRVALAGTLGQGLLVGDGTGTRWRTIATGLPSLNVTALAIHNGVVYVGTEDGLVKISEDKLM